MQTVNGKIRSLHLDGPAGRLEALLNAGAAHPSHAALVAHPHPLYGGTMHNKVVYHAMKALNGFGFPVLRFNFRGAGLSEGEHDRGRGEVDDVKTALAWMWQEFHLPIVFAGFSFGAATGMKAACADPQVRAIIALGTPVEAEGRIYAYRYPQHCTKPKLFLSGDRDPYAPREQLEHLIATVAEPRQLVLVEHAGHFFENKLADMRAQIEAWVRGWKASSAASASQSV